MMRHRLLRSLLVTACFFLPRALTAQNPPPKPPTPPAAEPTLPGGVKPTPEQAQVLLQTRPDLVAQLRQRLTTSGLTPDQVRARLRADGYPENLLDPYLSGESGKIAEPTDDVFKAVEALGVADANELASLRGQQQPAKASAGQQAPADGNQIFGLSVFQSATSQFEANLSGPVDANYRLGPGDQLVLILTGDVEASYQLSATREGFVVIPQVGQLYVANLTLGQLETLLYTRLSRVYSGIRANNQGTTRFSISVSMLRSNQVFVIGDVQRPGSYLVSSAGTALTALYAASGPSTNGSLRQIEIRRAGRTVDVLDVYDYLLRGDASHDVRLETGDVLFVPVHGTRVKIVGEIVRPAIYELKEGETLSDLVRDAGGFKATAARRHVLIERILPPGERSEIGRDRVTIDIASSALLTGTGPLVPLRDGDVVRIYPISEVVRDQISVVGNVHEPGIQALIPGETLAGALRKAGGILSDTYLGEVLVTRINPDGTRLQLRAALADSTGVPVRDLALQEADQISVYSLQTFRPDRYVAIGGAVKSGGRFRYREGITLRDLVLLAAGVQESAYLREAEIARMPQSRDSGRTATTIRVPLDSTYLFERKPNGEYIGPPGLAALASGTPEIPLQPYDNVLILRQPNWELQRTVVLQGEVRFPGTYALKYKSERLSDLVKRAGGLTEEAYADGIVFVRGQFGLGRVGVDLSTALQRYESSDNLILRDGDNITIPPFNTIVSIRGAVNQPSNVAYARGKNIDYYINAAGGPSRTADEGRAYVLQPSGKLEAVHNHFLRPSSVPVPLPGSVVTVPETDPADKKDLVQLIAQVGQIAAGLITIIILAKR